MIPVGCAAGFEHSARQLAEELMLEYRGVIDPKTLTQPDYVLFVDNAGLGLCATGKKAPGPVTCDFVEGALRHRRLYGGGKSQAIAKAVGIRDKIRPYVADLTAGLGADGFVLAALGCRVTLLERHSLVAALLADGLKRARLEADEELGSILDRITLINQDGAVWLASLNEEQRPDVIYLDPMFPEKKKSAQVKKSMQAFQALVGSDSDADALLPTALAVARYRVVVKRPINAPCLNNQAPGYSLKGKAVRFDIYPLRKMD